MLILTRRSQESICIGEQIVITVLGIQGNRVRIGIAAPPDVEIARQEVRVQTEPGSDAHQSNARRGANCNPTPRDDE